MTPWVTRLLVANVAMFLLSSAVSGLAAPLVLVPALLLQRPWTALTYMFLHADIMHLLFNMLGLYFFGPRLEERTGGRHFIALYIVSGLMGAALSLFTPKAPIVGASGAIFGIFLAFAWYWPRERVFIWGVLPIEARWLVIIMTVLALRGGIGGGGGVAHFAHLGGFVGGFLYLKWMELSSPARKFRRQAESPPVPARSRADSDDVERWQAIRRDELHEINREEVDRLLEKIQSGGLKSLTPTERECLDRFSAR